MTFDCLLSCTLRTSRDATSYSIGAWARADGGEAGTVEELIAEIVLRAQVITTAEGKGGAIVASVSELVMSEATR